MIISVLALALLLPAGAGNARGGTAAAPKQGEGTALIAVFLDAPERWDQAQRAGLLLYSHQSSAKEEYLLAGATLDTEGRLPELSLPARILDADATGASYILVFPQRLTGALHWADYGTVLLELEDQVLLRASAEQVEPLVEAGAEIVKISLRARPWPAAPAAAPQAIQAITPSADVQAMLDQVSTDTISLYTRQLTGEEGVTVDGADYTITTRHTYSGESIPKAAYFVGEHLQGLGMTPEYQVWGASGTPSTYPNVIGQITGSTNPDDIYMIGSHIDDMPSSGTAPGADDSASGSVATLIAADIFSQYRWDCTLRFGFWTGEEQGLQGSTAYATRASNDGNNILGYLDLDMLGYNSGAPNGINLIADSSVAGSVAMMDLFADAVSAYGLDLVPVKYTNEEPAYWCDNASFWNTGYPSILAIEDYHGDFNPFFHTSHDKLAHLDMDYYTDTVKAALATFVHMSGCLAAAPDFGVDITLATRDVCAPADAIYTVDVSSIGGFDAPVTGSASGLPNGATAVFSPNPVTAPGASTLTIGGLDAAAAGAYDVTVSGTSDTVTHLQNVTLNLSGMPAAAVQIEPVDGLNGVAAAPVFTWDAAARATSYTLQVATDPAFRNLVIDQSGLTGASYTPDPALAGGTAYYWRVRGANDCGFGPDSATAAFVTAVDGSPLEADFTDLSATYRVAWHTGGGALRLGLAWAADTSFLADADDADDDGVTRVYAEDWHDGQGEIYVTVDGETGQHACLDAWLDYSDGSAEAGAIEAPNGAFDANEHVLANLPLQPGESQLVTWPMEAGVIDTGALYNMRFRLAPDPDGDGDGGEAAAGLAAPLAPDGIASPAGLADGGEVEDYTFTLAPQAVDSLTIARLDSSQVEVSWSAVQGAAYYEVWSADNEPYFAPGADCENPAPYACTAETGTTFTGASLGDPAEHTVYLVRSVSSLGAVSHPGPGRAGKFEYSLVQGN